MCRGCFETYGEPVIINERTIKAAKLIKAVYEYSCVGGGCHIVLDDWNIETDHVQWCLDNHHNYCESDEQVAAEKECLELFITLSKDERASALAQFDVFFSVEASA